ncbi:hypothetical protein J3F84DRAFT_18417 [Trichoderma pleuroticola]
MWISQHQTLSSLNGRREPLILQSVMPSIHWPTTAPTTATASASATAGRVEAEFRPGSHAVQPSLLLQVLQTRSMRNGHAPKLRLTRHHLDLMGGRCVSAAVGINPLGWSGSGGRWKKKRKLIRQAPTYSIVSEGVRALGEPISSPDLFLNTPRPSRPVPCPALGRIYHHSSETCIVRRFNLSNFPFFFLVARYPTRRIPPRLAPNPV